MMSTCETSFHFEHILQTKYFSRIISTASQILYDISNAMNILKY